MLIQLFNVVAVILFVLTAVACTTPTVPPEPTTTARTERVETAVLPATATHTPAPTATPTPEPTPTLTADQLREQRATAVLITLPGYDPAQHDALLPLARALWGDEYVVDPAEAAIVVGETAVQVNADAAYPSDTLFVWSADSHLRILTGQPDTTIKRGEVALGADTLNTWVRYDLDGNVLEFVDPAGNWISPLDLQADGRFTFYTKAKIGPNGERELTPTIWWANGGTAVELTTSPIPNQPLADFLAETQLQLTQTEGDNGQHMVALTHAETGATEWTYKADTGQWERALQVEFVAGYGVANGQVYREGANGPELHTQMMEAMGRGGLEPLSVRQEGETLYFTVRYEGQEYQAELKARHAGIGQALIVRDVFVSQAETSLPLPNKTMTIEQSVVAGQLKPAINAYNVQFVEARLDRVVFVSQPDWYEDSFDEARFYFRGLNPEGSIAQFMLPVRHTVTNSVGGPIFMDISNFQRLTDPKNGIYRPGDILPRIGLMISDGSDPDARQRALNFYSSWGSLGEYTVGEWGTRGNTTKSVKEAIAILKAGQDIDLYTMWFTAIWEVSRK